MRPRTANAVTLAALAALTAGIALTAPRWARWLSEPIPFEEGAPAGEASPAQGDGSPEARRTIAVRIFFVSPETDGLVPEERDVLFSPELASQVKNVVAHLLEGSGSGLVSPFPAGAKVLEVFLTARGVAYVSLSPEAAAIEGGSGPELLAVYSLVNTITTNFASIRRVQILVGDRMVETLAGHVDLSRPLSPDLSLLVAASPSPSPAAAAEAPAAAHGSVTHPRSEGGE